MGIPHSSRDFRSGGGRPKLSSDPSGVRMYTLILLRK
jgi:hypothetical protein